MENITIVIIEDDKELKEHGLVWELKDKFNEVLFFENPDNGLLFIKKNQEKYIIVLLDISFPNNKNGHQILDEIRKTSFNIPVILWSGIDENQEEFSDFINNKVFAYIKKGTTNKDSLAIIQKAVLQIKMSIIHNIEDWINQHPESEKDKPIYITRESKSYSLNDILKEIRMQTKVGKDFSKRLTKLTIDLLMRNKESLND